MNAFKQQLRGELKKNAYGDLLGFRAKMVIPRKKEARITVSREIRDKVKAIAQKNNVNMATVVWLGARALEKKEVNA